jgi:peptide/nickel transport system substrate-binding protein
VNTPEVQRLAQALVSQWRDAGVDVNISNGEQTAMINEVLFGNYQAVSWAQFGAPHPDIEYLWWHSSTAEGPITLNAARNKDPELDKALDEARTTTDTEKQKALYFKVQQRLAADVPYIWFTHGTSGIVAAKRVRDVTTYTLPDGSKGLPLIGGIHPITQIWLAA